MAPKEDLKAASMEGGWRAVQVVAARVAAWEVGTVEAVVERAARRVAGWVAGMEVTMVVTMAMAVDSGVGSEAATVAATRVATDKTCLSMPGAHQPRRLWQAHDKQFHQP